MNRRTQKKLEKRYGMFHYGEYKRYIKLKDIIMGEDDSWSWNWGWNSAFLSSISLIRHIAKSYKIPLSEALSQYYWQLSPPRFYTIYGSEYITGVSGIHQTLEWR